MGKLYEKLAEDYRIKEGLKACINCGTCTAICPAAEFYKYDPRQIVDTVQSKNDEEIEKLLKSETIWYCGECMSCITRCPRKNAPGLVVMALRNLSMELGYFAESEKGRQQYALTKVMSSNILNYGYCVYPRTYKSSMHPESGPIWVWSEQHMDDFYARLGANLDGEGTGALRKIPKSDLDELQKIFDVTGATARIETINKYSMEKAKEMGLTEEEYFNKVFTVTEKDHLNKK
ncbi:MAG: 4Fe-4S dicluster domain-containing protein [Bacteroidales bacterium]